MAQDMWNGDIRPDGLYGWSTDELYPWSVQPAPMGGWHVYNFARNGYTPLVTVASYAAGAAYAALHRRSIGEDTLYWERVLIDLKAEQRTEREGSHRWWELRDAITLVVELQHPASLRRDRTILEATQRVMRDYRALNGVAA